MPARIQVHTIALRRWQDYVSLGAFEHGDEVAPAVVVRLRDHAAVAEAAVDSLRRSVIAIAGMGQTLFSLGSLMKKLLTGLKIGMSSRIHLLPV